MSKPAAIIRVVRTYVIEIDADTAEDAWGHAYCMSPTRVESEGLFRRVEVVVDDIVADEPGPEDNADQSF